MKKEKIYIILTYKINKEEKMIFSHCPELDIGSQGETVEEAVNVKHFPHPFGKYISH